MSSCPPILLLAWRRPSTLRQVIDAIRPSAPQLLFVACDGPNPKRIGEAEKVSATRQVIEQEIDWPCKIKRFYSDENQGCRLGVSSAITWFFENVEEGIILEDDCVPHPDFLSYCSMLLNHYRDDSRVWCISGSNFQNGQWRGNGSYYLSRYNHCWGWATWRRCWQHYDSTLAQWPSFNHSGLIESIFEDPVEIQYWRKCWERLFLRGEPDTWDYQWTFTMLVNGGLTILPNRNLINNVGFDSDATHTFVRSHDTSVDLGVFPLQHPTFFLRHAKADQFTFAYHYGGRWHRFPGILFFYPRVFAKYVYKIIKALFR
jgi:hypothetical protein